MNIHARLAGLLVAGMGLYLTVQGGVLHAADQPQWGQKWGRNLVSTERGLPDSFDPATGRNIRWTAPLGTETYSTPIIARGRVYIGTNNEEPRDAKHQGDRGILMCLNEADGSLLWQLVVPKRVEDPYYDWPKTGISSTVTVDGDRVYLVSNRGEVLCLDARGMANGNDGPFRDEGRAMTPAGTNGPVEALKVGATDADILWKTDLVATAGIWSHDAAHSSILVHGDYLYLNSGTGVDNTHRKIRTPDAPSLVVINKLTGEYVARDDEKMAPHIFHCTWSSPSMGEIDGRPLVFFAGGNGILYAFETVPPGARSGVSGPMPLRKVWQFDPDPSAPKEEVYRFITNRREGPSNIYGMPVFLDGRIYLAGGGDWFWGKNEAWLKCIDARGTGDITRSGVRWSAPLGRHTMCIPAVHDGLVYASDSQRTIHCLDAITGESVWTHEIEGEIWASAYVADGKVFVGTRQGDFWVFAAGREKRVLSTIELGQPIASTATAANGSLYLATASRLYAIAVTPRN